jgi:hypothetical protein
MVTQAREVRGLALSWQYGISLPGDAAIGFNNGFETVDLMHSPSFN